MSGRVIVSKFEVKGELGLASIHPTGNLVTECCY